MGGAVLMGEHSSSTRSWEQAEVPWEFRDRPSLVRSRQAMRASLDLVGENVMRHDLAIEAWAPQVLQEVLHNILGLHERPPDLARSLEEERKPTSPTCVSSANTPCEQDRVNKDIPLKTCHR